MIISYMVTVILLAVLAVILLVITWLMFVPVIILIDTTADQYAVKIRGIFSFRLVVENDEILFVMKVPFYIKTIYPFRPDTWERREHKKVKEKPADKPADRRSFMTSKKMLAAVRTFHVREFRCTVDTGNFAMNAWLVPVFQRISGYRNNLTINFQDEFALRFKATNNLWRVGKAILIT